MKRTLLINLLLIIVLCSGCNFPGATKDMPVNDLATSVASTLTAQPPLVQLPGEIRTPTVGDHLVAISPSPVSQETVTPSPTIMNTSTSTQTTTPEDPRHSLGDPTWKSNLDSGKAFGLTSNYEDDSGNTITILNGMMLILNPNTGGYLTWRLTIATPNDVYIEGNFKSQNCAGNDQFGIVFRAPDYSNGFGYYFGITCDGNYNLFRRDQETGKTVLLPLTPSVNLNSGSGQTNILGVLTKGNNIRLYANGKLLQELSDTKFSQGGHFGPFIMGFSGNNSIALDEIAYWIVP